MNTKGLIISGSVIVVTVLFVVAYSLFNVLGVTQSRVVRNEITIVTGSAIQLYDGTALSNDEWYMESGSLAEGDTLITSMNTSLTNPDTIPNEIGVTILNAEGENVTINYRINYKLGTLTVLPLQLTIGTSSITRYFDGNPVSIEEWSLQDGDLLEGHHIEYSMNSEITNPGTIDNEITIRVIDASGIDKTALYGITYNYGLLTVLSKKITVSTDTLEKTYDGTPLLGGSASITSGELADGHSIVYGSTSSITNPGLIDNQVGVTIFDGNGQNVTIGYTITEDFGTLTVYPMELVIRSADDSKAYDGTPLSNNTWTLVHGQIASTHQLVVSIDNEITNVGSIENTLYASVTDQSGNDVSYIYDIVLQPGTLTVEARDLIIETGSSSKFYDGTPLTSEEWNLVFGQLNTTHHIVAEMTASITMPGEIDNTVYIQILDENDRDVTDEYNIDYVLGTLTVRELSITLSTDDLEKDYDGTPLLGGVATVTSGQIVSTHTIEFGEEQSITNPGTITNEIWYRIHDQFGNDVTEAYDVDEDFGRLTVLPITIILESPDAEKFYDGTRLMDNNWQLLSGTLLSGHSLVVSVSSQITFPGTIDNTIDAYIINGAGSDVSDFYTIEYITGELTVYPREITITTITDQKSYDGIPLYGGEGTITIGTLGSGDYIVYGIEQSILLPGTIDNEITYTIYNSSGFNVTQGYNVTEEFGELTIQSIVIEISSDSDSKAYDGLPLSNPAWQLLGQDVLPGHSLVVEVNTEITNPGTVDNDIIVSVIDGGGNDVSEIYQFDLYPGTLTILPIELTISTIDSSKTYDETPLLGGEGTISIGSLLPGHTITYTTESSITNPGSITNEVTYTIYNEVGSDVTIAYDVTEDFGTLTITPIVLEISSGTSAKAYDGSILTNDVWTLDNGTVLPTHTLVVSLDEDILYPGTIDNTIVAYVLDEFGSDVSTYYDFDYSPGTLTILPINITISTGDDTKAYDGTPLLGGEGIISIGTLLPGHSIVYHTESSITNPGTITNEVTYTVYDATFTDVTEAYNITEDFGSLTILPINITIFTIDDTKPYDGTPLLGGDGTITSGSLLPGHYIVYNTTSSITNPGSISNDVTYTIYNGSGSVVTTAYNVTEDFGTLTILPINITISTIDSTKAYDGSPLLGGEGTISVGSLLPGDTITYHTESTITNPGSIPNEVTYTIYNAVGTDVTEGYHITEDFGTLTILPINITISTIDSSKPYDTLPILGGEGTITVGSLLPGHTISYTTESSITFPGSISNDVTYTIYNSTGKNVTSAYNVTEDFGTLTILPINITITTIDDTKAYDGTPLLGGEGSITSGALLGDHYIVYNSESSITNPGSISNDVTYTIYNGSGSNVTSAYNITEDFGTLTVLPINITITTIDDTKAYDGTPLLGGEGTITSGSLIGDHYIVYNSESSITNPGSISNDVTYTIYNGSGSNVTSAYNVTEDFGTLTILPINITISTITDSKTYDTTPLLGGEGTISGGSLLAGHTIVYHTESSITTPGSIDNIVTYTIYDATLSDVTSAYNISENFGTLTIVPIYITITTIDDSKPYDGTPLLGGTGSLSAGSLIGDHYIVYNSESSITYPGTISNDVTYTIFDGLGNDVTAGYSVTHDFGSLSIPPINITISTIDDSKTYDGTPLLGGDGTITSGSLVGDHYIVYDTQTSITIPGTITNTVTYTIYDGLGNDVTIAYTVTEDFGSLTVNPITLVISSGSSSKAYDGTPLFDHTWTLVSGSVLAGHILVIDLDNEITNPGTIDNDIIANVTDGLGNSVNDYYDFIYSPGTLTILPINITITTITDSKAYDGTELLGGEGTITSGSLLAGHYYVTNSESTLLNPGTISNVTTYTIYNASDVDVTAAYNITENFGTLTVLPVAITITTVTDTKTYDGTPLQGGDGSITAGSLRVGDYIIYDSESSITAPGSISNNVTYTIYDALGTDVTVIYDVTEDFGILTVNTITIVIQSPDASKIYDGTPLSDNTWVLISGSALAGHTLNVNVDNSITDIGSIPNTMFAYVLDGLDSDVSSYYTIIHDTGTLTILSSAYSSTQIATSSFDVPIVDVFQVYATTAGTIYFRDRSYGDYSPSGQWTEGVDHTVPITVNPFQYPGTALDEYGLSSTLIQIEYLRDQVAFLSPYFTVDTFTGDSDIHTTGDTSIINDINIILYTYDETDNITIQDVPMSNEELLYRAYVYANYLDVPNDTLVELQAIAAANGLSSESPTVISDVQTYIQNAATYNLDFAPIPDGEDVVIYFLTVSQEGICQHFAAAATLMYRTLGIPARYVIGYVGSVQSDQWNTVTSETAHAWTEVYIDGLGWVPVEVTAGGAGGTGGGGGGGGDPVVDPIEITVRPQDVVEVYEEGKTITASQLLIFGYPTFYAEGYTYVATYNGSLSEIGTTISTVASLTIYDSLGNDATDQFDITFGAGILQLFGYEIEIVTNSDNQTYDGTALTNSNYSVVGDLQPNHHIESITFTGEQTNVGSSKNIASIVIFDDLGNDVTSSYNITYTFGDLIVYPNPITIESDSGTKVFDGTPLTVQTYQITEGTLALTDTVEITITGSQTGIGSSVNTIESITILRDGVDVTSNYIINIVEGELSVTPF